MDRITIKPAKGRGRVTVPTDISAVEETTRIMERWGGDALRDCDGTEFPPELLESGAKVYSTYYTTRKDNAWARENPDEIQQMYVMTNFYMAESAVLRIPLMKGIHPGMLSPNTRDDIHRWWEVIDRTTGEVFNSWEYDGQTGEAVLTGAAPYHDYSVSFLAYIIWDPVHMYNSIVNGWDEPPQLTFDVRQPKTQAFSLKRLRRYCEENPNVSVIRFTTFFHQFTLIFDELKREKFVDWYGYAASVSPYILERFEREVGYPFRPEHIIDQGYMNNQYRSPGKEYRDFMAFQRREVAALARQFVEITHEYGKEAMMFLGDHWIGTEPYMDEFKTIGLDAVVGSVGNGSTLRLISDTPGVKYTEGRFLPYFFPDSFYEGADPVIEARENWITARRALLRNPIDRIGYGGYVALAAKFPRFVDYVAQVSDEFRDIYQRIKGVPPLCVKRVAVLNSWGRMRTWGAHMVHHAKYFPQNYAYAGVIEALSGLPLAVRFISFDDLLEAPDALADIDVIVNVGGAGTAHSGGEYWADPRIVTAMKQYVARGGGFIGVGEPSARQRQGRYFQLADILGVEEERGLTLNYGKYNWEEQPHFITEKTGGIDFGGARQSIYALEGTAVLAQRDKNVLLAANDFYKGRAVYIAGLPYSADNARLLYRAVLWASHGEEYTARWYADNSAVDVHVYPDAKQFCIVNNSNEIQQSKTYTDNGNSFIIELEPGELRWQEL